MIQFKRGTTKQWKALTTPLAAGQPGYDTTRKKLKIGDGTSTWEKLKDASGLRKEEVLDSVAAASARKKINSDDTTLITYGENAPDESTPGEVYIQACGDQQEVDYVVDYGVYGIWTYQKWRSGLARCFGTLKLNVAIKDKFITLAENALYKDANSMNSQKYPFEFKEMPTELATVRSNKNNIWLGTKQLNTKTTSGCYSIISPVSSDAAAYYITLDVSGRWK